MARKRLRRRVARRRNPKWTSGASSRAKVKIFRPRLRKKSGKVYASRSPRAVLHPGTVLNPGRSYMPMSNPRRRRRRGLRMNPVGMVRKLIPNKEMLRNGLTVAGGLTAGTIATPFASKLMAKVKGEKFTGVVHIALGMAMFSMLKRKEFRNAGVIIAGMGIYDIVANFSGGKIPLLPRAVPLVDGMASKLGASYRVAQAPVSPLAALGPGMGASYSPRRLAASYNAPAMSTVGVAGMGHSNAIDYDQNWVIVKAKGFADSLLRLDVTKTIESVSVLWAVL